MADEMVTNPNTNPNISGNDPDIAEAQQQQGMANVMSAVPAPQNPNLRPPQPPVNNAQGYVPPQPQQAKASVFHSILDTLAGPQYNYEVDANTGEMVRSPAKRSGSQLANSIVAGALTGLFAGSQVKGNNPIAALGAGGMARQQQLQQQDVEAQNKASKDFARKASIFETNMRARQNAMQLSQADYNMRKAQLDTGAHLLSQIKTKFPQMIAGQYVKASDLGKYNATSQNAIVDGIAPVLDDKRQQVKDDAGVPQWENTYTVLNTFDNPDQKFGINKDDIEYAKQFPTVFPEAAQLGKVDNPMARAEMILNFQNKVTALKTFQQQLKDFYKDETQAKNFAAGKLEQNEDKLGPLVDNAADRHGLDRGLFRAMINVESRGNPKAVSKMGAKGLGQLMDINTKGIDPFDPKQNLDRSAEMLSRLMTKYNNDPRLALAAYNAGEPAVDKGGAHVPKNGETEKYVEKIMGMLEPIEGADTNIPNLADAMKKDPSLAPALQAFANVHGLNVDERIKALQQTDPDAANRVADLFGGYQNIEDKAIERGFAKQEHAAKIKKDQEEFAENKFWRSIGIPKDTDLRGDELLSTVYKNNAAMGSLIEKVLNYEMKESDISNRADVRQNIYALAGLVNSKFDSTDLDKKVQAKREYADGYTAKGLVALNTALDHMARAYDHANVWTTTPGIAYLNEKAFGSKFAADKEAITNEIGKAYKAGVIDKDERESWLKLLNAWTPKTVKTNIEEMTDLLHGAMEARYQQYRKNVPYGQFAIVDPAAAKSYEHITGKPVEDYLIGKDPDAEPEYTSHLKGTTPKGAQPPKPVIVNGEIVGYTTNGKTMKTIKKPQAQPGQQNADLIHNDVDLNLPQTQ